MTFVASVVGWGAVLWYSLGILAGGALLALIVTRYIWRGLVRRPEVMPQSLDHEEMVRAPEAPADEPANMELERRA